MKPNIVFLIVLMNIGIFMCKCEYTGRFNSYLNHSCIRDCSRESKPMICEYDWTLELYSTLSRACYNCPNNFTDCLRENCILADGFTKTIEVINRLMPGPGIQVCKGDTVVVNLDNRMRSERVTSIHWHGIKQKGTPYMDGVGMVTQCPIVPHTSFQYKFVAEDPGTHFWHAHSGAQRADGIFGALIVREDKNTDVNGDLYDFDLKEHYMILNDWTNLTFQAVYGPYTHAANFPAIHTILVNGKGIWPESAGRFNVPLETYYVKKGYRYRFRLINAGIDHCPIQLSIEGHNITMIASDGQPFEPVSVESFVSMTGERYDFVVNAMANDDRDYVIKIRGEGSCNKLTQRAILRYERDNYQQGAHLSTMNFTFEDSKSTGLQLRTFKSSKPDQPVIMLADLRSPKGFRQDYFKALSGNPDKKIYLNFDLIGVDDGEHHQSILYPFSKVTNRWESSLVNRIKFEMPNQPPLYNWESFDKSRLCNSDKKPKVCQETSPDVCTCIHTIEVGLNDLVEMFFIDGGAFFQQHPTHLHGHNYAVIGTDDISNIVEWNASKPLATEFLQQLDQQGRLKRNFDRPPVKDTFTMPTRGYAIVRFIADNPGFWLLHCHIEPHSDTGMIIMLKVGESKDLPPKPKNWPTCGSYNVSDVTRQPTQSTAASILQYIFENIYNFYSRFRPN